MICNIVKNNPVILAPMSGVTDLPFRTLVKEFGSTLVISEMVASRAMIIETRQSMQKSDLVQGDATSCVQLAGCDPSVMAEAAKMNEDTGARIIDINFGCPAKKVVGGYAGSWLMRDESLAFKILESVVNAVKVPVTLKMRMGWDENTKNAVHIAQIAENIGIQMITVHGRTRCQFYSGNADWSFVKQVKESVKIPVIVNGDIDSYSSVTNALELSAADGIMIGRGVYGRPWFLNNVLHYLKTGEIPSDPALFDQYEIVMKHYESILEYYGTESGIKIARKHLGWYSSGMRNASNFRARINTTNDVSDVKKLIHDLYHRIDSIESVDVHHV